MSWHRKPDSLWELFAWSLADSYWPLLNCLELPTKLFWTSHHRLSLRTLVQSCILKRSAFVRRAKHQAVGTEGLTRKTKQTYCFIAACRGSAPRDACDVRGSYCFFTSMRLGHSAENSNIQPIFDPVHFLLFSLSSVWKNPTPCTYELNRA